MHQEEINFINPDRSFSFSYREKTGHYTMRQNHFHDAYEIYYLLKGERYYFIKSRTFHIRKGDLVFIRRHDLHKTLDAGVPDHQRILIHFSEDYMLTKNASVRGLLDLIVKGSHPVIRLSPAGQTQIEGLLLRMLQEAGHRHTSFEVSLQSLLMQLLVQMARYMENNSLHLPEHPSPLHRKASEIVEYVNEHYREPLRLSLVSEHFYISQSHLSRLFKAATGFTFVEYLNSVRIKEAQKLLRETDAKVTRIVEKVGFGSIAHFGRVFKAVMGYSPLEYRKMNKM